MKEIILLILLSFPFVFSQNQQEESGLAFLRKSEEFFNIQEGDSAYYYAVRSVEELKAAKNDSLLTEAIINLLFASGKVQVSEQERDSYFLPTNKKLIEQKEWELLAKLYYARGASFYLRGMYSEALLEYLKVDSLSEQYLFKSNTTFMAILQRADISRLSFTHDGVELAQDLMYEALTEAKALGSRDDEHLVYTRLADIKGMIGEYSEAKKYTDLAFNFYKESDNISRVSWLYSVYTNYYIVVDSLDKAEETYHEQITYLRQKESREELARGLISFANFYRKEHNDCNTALLNFKEAKQILDELKQNESKRYVSLIEGMAICFAESGNYREAYEYYREVHELDNLLKIKNNMALSRELESKYQGQQKEQEIELLKSQNELAQQQEVNQRNLLLGGLGISTLAGLFFFFQYRNRQKTNKKLKELDTAKSHFFANISHEFRTPLTLIQSPIDEELEKEELEVSLRKTFGLIKRNSQRLLDLVDQLLMLSKIESKTLTLNVQELNLKEFLLAISSSFEYGFKQKHIEFDPKLDMVTKGYIDVDVFEKILTNLLSNALKYTPEHGNVKLDGKAEGGKLELQIANSGEALTSEEFSSIFKRFYQLDSTQQGYGIGLTLVKELTEVHRGSINASGKDNFTIFKITLPIAKDAYHSHEFTTNPKLPPGESKLLSETTGEESNKKDEKSLVANKPVLLIVEDQNDMRHFINGLFADFYEVIEAKNGKVGLEEAFRYIPDVIISDIMMPEVDGIELTETLKRDHRTSHIPIVMLTAKVDDLDKIKGLETGADDYMIKPFKAKLLQTKVTSLLDNRAKLREHYNHEVVLKPAIFSYNKTEEKFFAQLQDVINQKLQDPSFHVNSFCKFVGMSRMHLHRKLRATLGVSTSEFLRNERLKAAKNLLESSQLSVSEVAYTSGFNDANYFSKSFKKLFKIAPQEFKKQ